MVTDLLDQFLEYWGKKQFAEKEQIVLLAVSGGMDSMVMADLFQKSGIKFAVAHCNFGLRGEASDLDERLVRDWCNTNNIVIHSILFDTKQKSLEWKKATQETARILRYEWFEVIRQENKYAVVATAHHANDNVETLMINLFKGTGISGIHGIMPRQGRIIRPLLFAGREMIASYATENKIPFREDASNATDDYLRNAVRHNIIPAVQQLFPHVIGSVNESIARFSEAEILYKRAIDIERKQLLDKRGHDYYIPIRKLLPREPLATICYELLVPFGFTSRQLPHVLSLLESESGRHISSSTHRIIRNRDFLVITSLPAETADLIVIDAVPCKVNTGKFSYSFSVHPKPKIIPADPNIACLTMAEIEFPIVLRTWRTGDYFYPLGMKMKKKKVSRLLVDEKIALHDKEDIRILECNKRIAWVSGIRLDDRFKIKESTEQALVVKREKNQ
jgi:tRNA(Ile)-lysidine synthase